DHKGNRQLPALDSRRIQFVRFVHIVGPIFGECGSNRSVLVRMVSTVRVTSGASPLATACATETAIALVTAVSFAAIIANGRDDDNRTDTAEIAPAGTALVVTDVSTTGHGSSNDC